MNHRGRRLGLGGWRGAGLAVVVALFVGGVAAAAPPPRSLLDRLPRPQPAHWAAAVAAAHARGSAGLADAAWIETFYGDAAARRQARHDLEALGERGPDHLEAVFADFVLDEIEGQQRQEMRAALQMVRLAPNDPAAEIAAREISGILDGQGRLLLDAAPELRQVLGSPLADPTTIYMLSRPLLALVRAPGVPLSLEQAMALGGRLQYWTLFGPFGMWRNLDFDHSFPIERQIANQYAGVEAGAQPRVGQAFDAVQGIVEFPGDWADQGIVYGVTYVRIPARGLFLLRAYSPASFDIQIDGVSVLHNDLRSAYRPAAAVAALEMQPGWHRIVVKLGGYADREFSLVLRPAAGGEASLENAAALPAGAALSAVPRVVAPPPTLAAWAEAHATDPVALWADGVRRLQDEDAESGRVELEKAAKLVPNSTAIWLTLADTYAALPDASQSWSTAQSDGAARQAEKTDPAALAAADHLGHDLESEGKLTDAAAEYAKCSGRGYADCDWAAFRLDVRRQWTAEAARDLTHALAASPSDWPELTYGLRFYTQVGDRNEAAHLEAKLRQDPRADGALGRYFMENGRAATALPLLAAAARFDPSSVLLRRDEVRAALLAGDRPRATALAQQALRDFPNDWRLAEVAGEVALAGSVPAGVAQFRATDYDRNLLRHQADFLADDQFWAPWYHAADDVIKDAPGKEQYPNAHSVLVLDQMVDRINPDSTRDWYIHQIVRVLDAAGIEASGTVSITEGSDLLTVRTIKPDGTVLLPENVSNTASIQMPGLEPGDFIETEYVAHQPPSDQVPGTITNDTFFVFNSSTQPYHYSDYIVLAPDSYPLMVNEHNFPNPPVITHHDGWTAREWLIQKTRILGREPNMPPEQELVPRVWVSSKMTWDEISEYFADEIFSLRRATAEMSETARGLARAAELRAPGDTAAAAGTIFDWVAANIQPAERAPLAPARQYFVDRSGNRLAVFLGLLSAADIPYDLVMARPVTDHSTLEIPNSFTFLYPLVRVATTDHRYAWFDLNGDFARRDYISPAFRGGQALMVGATGANEFITVPTGPPTLDGLAIDVRATVALDGDATVHLTLEFRGPLGEQLRQNLASIPDSRLPQIYQQVLLQSYPNGTAQQGQIQGRNDHNRPLVITIDGSVPNFLLREADRWEIDHLMAPVGLLTRYADLPARIHPLVIPGDSIEEAHAVVTLPSGFAAPQLPANVHVQNQFGAYQETYQVSGSNLAVNRSLYLKANYILPPAYEAFRKFSETVDGQDRLPITGSTR